MPENYNYLPKGLRSALGWYDRGYLPHFDGGESAQFLTFRLHDSLPSEVVEKWRATLGYASDEAKAVFRKNVEKYLDAGYGECYLRDPEMASLVEGSIRYFAGKKYGLSAWVVMPNHVHMLVRPRDGVELSAIAHSIKSYTAHEMNKRLGRQGQIWQHEVFDRYIRNRQHFVNVVRYIEQNPVKAGLCGSAEEWPFSSARFRNDVDQLQR